MRFLKKMKFIVFSRIASVLIFGLLHNAPLNAATPNDLAEASAEEAKFFKTRYLVLAPLDPGTKESDFNYGADMVNQIGTRGNDFLLSAGVVLYAFNEDLPRMESKLLKAFQDAENNNLPLLIHMDFEVFSEGRPDLWNWFDPKKPGYNLQNKYNVEWSGWDKPIKNYWLNWGSPWSIAPKLCYTSPVVRSEIVRIANALSAHINTWRINLAKKHKSYLFAGVNAGWETSMPDLTKATWAPSERDNLGYCSLHHRGFSEKNPPANYDTEVRKVVKEFIDFESKVFSDNGIPRSKIYTHIAASEGMPNIPSQRSSLENAFNSYSTPGYSLYTDGNGGLLYNDAAVKNLVRGKTWAIIESPTDRNVVRYMSDPNLKLISFYSWGFNIKNNAPIGNWQENQKLVKEILNFKTVANGEIRGTLDEARVIDGKTYLLGWACNSEVASAIDLHVYVDGPSPKGTFLIATSTNQEAEVSIQNACGISSPLPMVRFKIEIPDSLAIQHQNKPIYIHGMHLSGRGDLNKLLGNSGVLKLPARDTTTPPKPVNPTPPAVDGEVRGYLDSVRVVSGKTYVSGWACNSGIASPINLHIYADGSASTGKFLLAATTNKKAEKKVQEVCGISSPLPMVRFKIEIPEALAIQYQDKPIYIHGIHLSGRGDLNNLIGNSGILKLPARDTTTPPNPVNPPTTDGEIRGNLDIVRVVKGKTYLSGWACNSGIASPINIHIYVDGSASTGKFLLAAATNKKAEVGIQNACGISSPLPMVRFKIEIPEALAIQYQDKSIYIHGIHLSGNGNLNKLIGNSGVLRLPKR
jgi:hypothetical protein